ncbi:acetylxylan esterase [Verrucomicrobium sp. BvORR106]|uniref:glucuronyl esterase domain-containing protein n=1 Tax=Verrucomicrobium sp. BvORR106 TaxID=1403819 RepID=UPI0009E0245A|nr:acetylxylan esterase [Verrucomicrobium sp. BvORR106]
MHRYSPAAVLMLSVGTLATASLTMAQTATAPATAAKPQEVINQDEAHVGNLAIPDPLTCTDGTKVTTKEQWLEKRRPELFKLFETEVYGRTPEKKLEGGRMEVLLENKKALEGKATQRLVRIYFTKADAPSLDVLVYLPNAASKEKPAGVFVGLNFGGNHAVTEDPAIPVPQGWFRNNKETGVTENRATEASRGADARRWPIAEVIARGYGVATAYYGDLDPDFDDGFQNGVQPLFYKAGQTKPEADEWGSIGAWAWGLSRMADYLVTLPEVDGKRLAVLGHSRLGKTSLWAGAQDTRFSIVISNNSGAGGAALSKRHFGETVNKLNTNFPHWFNGNFKKYSINEAALPVDQHELIALCAPRPVYVASATEDLWADPKGEFLGAKLAEPVYALFGKKGLGVSEPPAPDVSVGEALGYHNRTGKHDILLFDWEKYMDFADKNWGK